MTRRIGIRDSAFGAPLPELFGCAANGAMVRPWSDLLSRPGQAARIPRSRALGRPKKTLQPRCRAVSRVPALFAGLAGDLPRVEQCDGCVRRLAFSLGATDFLPDARVTCDRLWAAAPLLGRTRAGRARAIMFPAAVGARTWRSCGERPALGRKGPNVGRDALGRKPCSGTPLGKPYLCVGTSSWNGARL